MICFRLRAPNPRSFSVRFLKVVGVGYSRVSWLPSTCETHKVLLLLFRCSFFSGMQRSNKTHRGLTAQVPKSYNNTRGTFRQVPTRRNWLLCFPMCVVQPGGSVQNFTEVTWLCTCKRFQRTSKRRIVLEKLSNNFSITLTQV